MSSSSSLVGRRLVFDDVGFDEESGDEELDAAELTRRKREAEEAEEARRRAAEAYNDDLIFDNLVDSLPGKEAGKWLLVVSIVLQVVVVVTAFLAHHRRTTDFDCCNMVAVVVASGLLVVQVPYLTDWFDEETGSSPQWHRGNLFVPFFYMVIPLFEYSAGVVSMTAQAIGISVFDWINVSELGFWEGLAFLVCTSTLGVVVLLYHAVDWAHRNNLGNHYYYVEEKPGALIELSNERTPPNGAFKMHVVVWFVTSLQIDTPRKAEAALPRLISLAVLLEVPFYLFATIAYTVDRETTIAPIVIMSIGVLTFVFNWQYFVGAITRRSKKTRHWNRVNLWFPSKVAFVMIFVYIATMANMFFKTTDRDLYEALPDLDDTERALLWTGTAALLTLFAVQLLIATAHRKVWATERDTGRGVRDPLELRAEASVFGVSVKDERDEQHMLVHINTSGDLSSDDFQPGAADDDDEEDESEFDPRTMSQKHAADAATGREHSDSEAADQVLLEVSVASDGNARGDSDSDAESSDSDSDDGRRKRVSQKHAQSSAKLRASIAAGISDNDDDSDADPAAAAAVLGHADDDSDDGAADLLEVTDA